MGEGLWADPMDFQVFTWHGRDAQDSRGEGLEYIIDAYGRTADGRSVCAHVSFTPYFFVSIEGRDPTTVSKLRSAVERKVGAGQLVACSQVTRKRFYGFSDGSPERFLLLRLRSMRALRKAAAVASEAGCELFETNVPPELRLLHIQDLPSVGWVRCCGPRHLLRQPCTICNVEFDCSYKELQPLPQRTDNAPLVVASFDIECVSEHGGFPSALEPGSPIIQIATTFWRITDAEPYKRHLVCLGNPAALGGVAVEACKSEAELLLAWANALRTEQADILLGYNIWGFDFKYIYDRAALRGALGTRQQPATTSAAPAIRRFPYHMGGKRTDHLSEIQVRKLESSAYGQNEFCAPSMPGVLQVDLLAVVKKEFKLVSYKLDAVSEHFLGDRKVDLPIKEMFALYKEGSPDSLRSIATYCVKDTELPIRLLRKLAILPNMMEMAKAVHVPIDYLIFRGQQIKVFSVILKRARQEGYVCPAKPLVTKTDKYTGATVLEARVGAHFGRIVCLDFASLYPSIVRAHNMCHSTIVLDDSRYGNLAHIEYEEHVLDDGQKVKFAVAHKETGAPVPSLLPALLAELAEYRKQARAEQKRAKETGDAFLAELYNGKQLAYKVTMNSLYGFCGAATGLLPCVPIAAAITGVGRQMIATTKSMVEALYPGASVVYGDTDSVMVDLQAADMAEAFRLGEEAAARITAAFKRPIELEFEKVMSPFLLYSKKRYASLKFTSPTEQGTVDAKGISLVRRDSCQLVKEVTKGALDCILVRRDAQAAKALVHQAARRLLAGQVELDELVMSKALRGDYKAGVLQPHDVVRSKIAARSPGEEPRAGDRVQFVYTEAGFHSNGSRMSVTCRAEDPAHVKATGMRVDLLHYLGLLKSALGDTIEVMAPALDAVFEDIGEGEYLERRRPRELHDKNVATGQREITSFFSTVAPPDPFL